MRFELLLKSIHLYASKSVMHYTWVEGKNPFFSPLCGGGFGISSLQHDTFLKTFFWGRGKRRIFLPVRAAICQNYKYMWVVVRHACARPTSMSLLKGEPQLEDNQMCCLALIDQRMHGLVCLSGRRLYAMVNRETKNSGQLIFCFSEFEMIS